MRGPWGRAVHGAAMNERRFLRLLSHHQLGAIASTVVDYLVMIVCVSVIGLHPVAGTIAGAASGAFTSFTLGRRWIFHARGGELRGQVLRYALVSAISLCGNALGEGLLVLTGLNYILSRVVIATLVGVGWNFPMHRHFVFRPDRAIDEGSERAHSHPTQQSRS
jgi:putative flippase GtrA